MQQIHVVFGELAHYGFVDEIAVPISLAKMHPTQWVTSRPIFQGDVVC